MNRKRYIITLVLLMSVALSLAPTPASAAQFYDKGRAYTTWMSGYNFSQSIAVMSAATNKTIYGTNNYLEINERIRTWGRIDTFDTFRSNNNNWVSRTQLRCYTDDSRATSGNYYIIGKDPLDYSESKSTNLLQIAWDILSLYGIPTNTIQAIANNTTAYAYSSGANQDYIREFYNQYGISRINLPTWISYDKADEYKGSDDRGCGATAYYLIHVTTNPNTSWKMYPQGKIQYASLGDAGTINYFWTNWAGLHHTVN